MELWDQSFLQWCWRCQYCWMLHCANR